MRKRIIIILVLVIAVTVAGVLWSGRLGRQDPNVIKLSGNIELTRVDISFKTSGKLVERNVDEGDAVKKGMLIARIDRALMDQQKNRDAAGVSSAEWAMQQSRTSIDWQRQTLTGDLELKRAAVQQAQAHLDELLAGSRLQEIQQAQSAVADVRAQNEQARLDWERAQTLFKNDDISKSQHDAYRTRFESTAAALKQAQQRLALVREGRRKEEIAAARAQMEPTKAALQVSEANRMEIQRRRQELDARLSEVERAKAQVGMTDAQLDETTGQSRGDGLVLL